MQTQKETKLSSVFDEAWRNVKGTKGAVWIPVILLAVLIITANTLFSLYSDHHPSMVEAIPEYIAQIIIMVVGSLVVSFPSAGIIY